MAQTEGGEMTAREEILNRVRAAVGRSEGQAVKPPTPPRIRIPEIAPEERYEMFKARLEVLGGRVYRAARLADAAGVVAEIRPPGTAVASNAPILRDAGITALPDVITGLTEEARIREMCAHAACGITGADYGMAQTGSLVTIAASEARLVSLLPPVHIGVLRMSRMLTGLDEFYTLVPKPADAACSTVFITGPSRSADIEMILVRGVHGPKAIHVIVVDE